MRVPALLSLVLILAVACTDVRADDWSLLSPDGDTVTPRRGVLGVFIPDLDRVVFQGGQYPQIQSIPETWWLDLSTVEWQFAASGDPTLTANGPSS